MSRPKIKSAPPTSDVALRLKIRIGKNTLGPGKLNLLRLIDKTGSISAAAREMGIGYRRAQFLLETLQSELSAPLVITKRGTGGGASLSQTARELLSRHAEFTRATEDQAAAFLAWLANQRCK